jgi:uncharacterized membrane protein
MRIYPRFRADALTDGIYAIVMTLLILELKLPAGVNYTSGADLAHALVHLWPEFLAYAISFFVLALRWRGNLEMRPAREELTHSYLAWLIVYLFFITCVPFTTNVVGRYGNLPPAVWLYAANMILGALTAFPLAAHGPNPAVSRAKLAPLIAGALLSVVLSFFVPRFAMTGYLLALLGTPAAMWVDRRQRKHAVIG